LGAIGAAPAYAPLAADSTATPCLAPARAVPAVSAAVLGDSDRRLPGELARRQSAEPSAGAVSAAGIV